MDILKEITEGIEQGDDKKVMESTRRAVEEKIPPKEILDRGLIEGMNLVGKKYKTHEIFLPQVLLAAKAMHVGMDVLKPLFIKGGMPDRGKVVIGSVLGDLHDIGKNLVGIMLTGAGFKVIDLGVNVSPEKFIQTAMQEKATIIGMSALLITTMPVMRRVVELLKQEGLGGKIKIVIGGAPVSHEFAQEIGADAYGYDSTNAVEVIRELIK